MRAYIQGINALRQEDPTVRILTTEPLTDVVPPLNATEEELAAAAREQEYQYQATDILVGKICPELGGSPEHMDMLGLNFYYNNRWILGFQEFLPWVNIPVDPRWKPLSYMLAEAYHRYHCPIVLAETSHSGEHRPDWIESVSKQCAIVLQQDIPLWGICLYPIIDRPDWNELHQWHRSGLWDAAFFNNQLPARILHQPYAEGLRQSQKMIHQLLKNKQQAAILVSQNI